MIYEYRGYEITPGKAGALHDRFTQHTICLMRGHGFRIQGIWEPVVGQASQVRLVTDELRGIDAGGFAVRQWPSAAAAIAAVRDREVAPAYVSDGPAAVYLAPPRPSGPTISTECSPVSPPWPTASLLSSSTWFPWQPVAAAPGYSSSSSC